MKQDCNALIIHHELYIIYLKDVSLFLFLTSLLLMQMRNETPASFALILHFKEIQLFSVYLEWIRPPEGLDENGFVDYC